MLVLVRDAFTETAILGRLFLGGTCIAYTCENRSKAIPCGVYNVENSKSPKFKREPPPYCMATRSLRLAASTIHAETNSWVALMRVTNGVT